LAFWQPWLNVQDRDQQGRRTPRWRGVTLLHELRSKGIPVAMASDNTRDQFFAYGDLDMLEVFNQVLNGQLVQLVGFNMRIKAGNHPMVCIVDVCHRGRSGSYSRS